MTLFKNFHFLSLGGRRKISRLRPIERRKALLEFSRYESSPVQLRMSECRNWPKLAFPLRELFSFVFKSAIKWVTMKFPWKPMAET